MKIKQVHIGAFGGLSDCQKELNPGLNVIYGENGAGKSTFLAFIKTCLYGFETKGREKYSPWNGTAPQGSLVYEQDGEWLYQAKFGKTKKGDKISLLNNQNGEERSVPESLGRELFSMGVETFKKTACVSQGQLGIAKDNKDEIAEKLANLEQTGESQVSYGACTKVLTSMLSKLRNKRGDGGLLNEAEQKILEYREQEQASQGKMKLSAEYYRRMQEIEKELQSLAQLKNQWEAYEQSEQKRLCLEYQEKLNRLSPVREDEDENYQELEDIARKWQQDEETLRWLEAQNTELEEPQEVLCSQEEFARVMAGTQKPVGMMITCAVLAVISALCGIFVSPLCFVLTILFTLGTVIFATGKTVQPWEAYGFDSAQEFSQKYTASLEEQSSYEASLSQQKKRDGQLAELKEKIKSHEAEGKKRNCLTSDELFSFCDGIRIRQAEKNSVLSQRETYEELLQKALAGKTMEEVCKAADTPKPEQSKENVHQKQLDLTREREQLEAKQQHLFDVPPEVLTATRIEWEQKKEEYSQKEQIYSVTLEVLEQAYQQMEQQFGSSLNQRAGELLEQMTKGKYNQVRISKKYEVKLTEDTQNHSLEQFSGGVFDQTYLAYRLAMLELMETGAPLLLDDVLMQYDDSRAEETIGLLEEYAREKDTQILLFTCRNRDFALAKQRKNINCIEIL